MGSLYAVAQPAAMDSTKAPADTVRIMTSNPEARSQAQAGPVLAAEELRRAKWFYSMSEAMREPEKVYKLSLSRKKLKRMPTDIIMRFPNLQVLNLSQNKIKEIPDEIIRLKNLQTLILHHNKLRKLPADMREMGELQELYLGYNKFIQVPAWVGGLGKLRRLDITSNQLTLYEIELVQKRLPRCEVTH
ncbi:MAG: leucine-rich repeat domain-containing protein [Bacteroidota bacterium]